jgi:outer membrane protein OmpA-like peptidoglycan-associated protein
MKPILYLTLAQTLSFSTNVSGAPDGHRNDSPAVFIVSQLIDTADGKTLAVIDIDRDSGLDVGMTLASFRAAGPEGIAAAQKIAPETGLLKVKEVGPEYALADVIQQGSVMSNVLYPKFPGIMSGDRLIIKPQSISARKFVTPEAALSYFALFSDPKASPSSFELSPNGIENLKLLVRPFLNKRASMIMIEGHTDQHGSTASNQVESYQRAQTVRQYLIDHAGFDPKRVLVIGYGESELIDESMVDGAIEKNRRIVVKIAAE